MKPKFLIILLILALFSISCERDLDFSTPSEEEVGNIVINSVAVEDTVLTVFVNKTFPVGKTPRLVSPDYDQAVFFKDDLTTDYVSNIYYTNTAITDAEVKVIVNGEQTYTTSLTQTKGYVCGYKPQPGDHIVVAVSAEGQELRAETAVPSKPKIEILNHEVIDQNPYQDRNGLYGGTDTIMRLTCRISDIGGEQYYRLRIRSEKKELYSFTDVYNDKEEYTLSNYMQDVYFSDDELFYDTRLTTSMGGWATNFSTVFDNSLMRNGSYTFTVDSPKAGNTSGIIRDWDWFAINWKTLGSDIPPRVMVELQAISPELYQYIKSVQLYRVTAEDVYAEPIKIFSNVQNGWGIFGALSYDRHFVEYGE
ncbi:MAG: DUF4249 family protein [Bacteroidaceae bacterium]|nr:DUF4249 family protein [Bacteroidaceae bacterium]